MSARAVLACATLGVACATLCWVVSDALNAPHLWPGTILAFVVVTGSNLLLLRRQPQPKLQPQNHPFFARCPHGVQFLNECDECPGGWRTDERRES